MTMTEHDGRSHRARCVLGVLHVHVAAIDMESGGVYDACLVRWAPSYNSPWILLFQKLTMAVCSTML